jgi:hypothetical protein
MKLKFHTFIIATAVLWFGLQAASAQQFCAPHGSAVSQLEKQFEEQVAGRGLAENGKRMLELFVSDEGSWTLLASDARGRSCVVASGENWHGKEQLIGEPT